MTFWINQHLIETRDSLRQWRTNRHVKVVANVDHIELAASHIVLGLNVGWGNLTEKSITVIEIQVALYKPKQEDVLLRLLPLERFGRHDLQRTLIKTPLSQFKLKPKEVHMEHIRFISHQSLNLVPAIYQGRYSDSGHPPYELYPSDQVRGGKQDEVPSDGRLDSARLERSLIGQGATCA